MAIELTPRRALELMREVVAEYGADHVYVDPNGRTADGLDGVTCVYVDWKASRPSCLVGHALFRAGVTVEQLAELDYAEDGSDINGVYSDAFELVDGAELVFSAAQMAQDKGQTWGTALARAERRLADLTEEQA